MVMPGEPWALKKLKEGNEKYARLARDEELSLRQAGVTGWHAAQDARPGANAKAETAAQLLLVLGLSPLFMVSTSPALALFFKALLFKRGSIVQRHRGTPLCPTPVSPIIPLLFFFHLVLSSNLCCAPRVQNGG